MDAKSGGPDADFIPFHNSPPAVIGMSSGGNLARLVGLGPRCAETRNERHLQKLDSKRQAKPKVRKAKVGRAES